MNRILSSLALAVLMASSVMRAEQWAVFETSFTSARTYDNPFVDVQVDVVFREWADKDCFAAGIPGKVRFIYQPKRGIYNWKGTTVKGLEPEVRYSAFYFDPATGRRFDQGTISAPTGEYKSARLPSPQDWVLVLENQEMK